MHNIRILLQILKNIILYFNTYAKTLTNRFGLKKVQFKKGYKLKNIENICLFPLHCINGKTLESLHAKYQNPLQILKNIILYFNTCANTLTKIFGLKRLSPKKAIN